MANAGKPGDKKLPSLGQLEQLHNLLKSSCAEDGGGGQKTNSHSLDGRKAMIPIGTKAFYEGTLSPTIKSKPDKNNAKTSQSAQEHVLANIGDGYLAEMTTVEACSYIERRMGALRKLNEDHANSALKADPTKDSKKPTKSKPFNKGGGLKMKKGFLQSKSKKVSSKNSRLPSKNKPSKSVDDEAPQTLPFIEIREELDKEGNEIKAEALDVSKELLSLHRTIHSKKEESVAQNRPEAAGIIDALAGSVPQSIDSSVVEGDVDDVRKSNTEEVEAATSTADSSSDTQERPYEEITARLDELILLEEKEEEEKARNKKSSKKLQGRWKKGFLSGDTSEKKKHSQPKKSIEKPLVREIIPSKETSHTSTSINASKSKKTVKFGSDEIKEIPRIGRRSINEVIKVPSCASTRSQIPTESTSYNSQSSLPNNDSAIIHSSSTSLGQTVMGTGSDRGTMRKPSKSVSIGGVTERARSSSAQEKSNAEPKKKLSRFAQRRLEQQGR